MSIRKLILCVCFTSINLSVFGQASWQYFFWFNLYDIQGNKITLEEYKKGNIKLFSEPFGVYGDNKLEYDTLNNSFKFSQHTVVTDSRLVFITHTDTTIIDISTRHLYVKKLYLINGYFDMTAWWGKQENFRTCKKFLGNISSGAVIYNKNKFESYKTEEKQKRTLEYLVEVKL